MIASPLPLVDIAPYLSIQKLVLCILCMDTGWNEIFTFVQRLCANCDLTTIFSLLWQTLARRHVEDMLSGSTKEASGMYNHVKKTCGA